MMRKILGAALIVCGVMLIAPNGAAVYEIFAVALTIVAASLLAVELLS